MRASLASSGQQANQCTLPAPNTACTCPYKQH